MGASYCTTSSVLTDGDKNGRLVCVNLTLCKNKRWELVSTIQVENDCYFTWKRLNKRLHAWWHSHMYRSLYNPKPQDAALLSKTASRRLV
jgi:hypothetical protein